MEPPTKVTVSVEKKEDLERLSLQIPLGIVARAAVAEEDYPRLQGKPTYYICKDKSCQPPVTELRF